MIKKTHQITAIALSLLFILNGCASVLNFKRQKLNMYTNQDDTKIYVNGELEITGKNGYVKVERDMEVRQIRVDVEGYKPEYFALTQYKKSPLYIMSWIPFGVLLLMPPLMDVGNKSFDYDKQRKLTPRTPKVKREEGQKYVYLDRTTFEVDKKDIVIEKYPYRRYMNGKDNSYAEFGDKDINASNSIFTDDLNNLLIENGYVDTLNTLFKDKTNTLYISADVDKITFREVYLRKSSYYNWFGVVEMNIKWVIQDVYKQPLFEKEITMASGEFSPDYYFSDKKFFNIVIEDAMSSSFYEFLGMEETQELLKAETIKIPTYETLSMEKPLSTPAKLGAAQEATVTVKTKKGHGSGCLVSKDGYIITNYHVVAEDTEAIEIILQDGEKLEGTLVRQNEYYDLALIKIEKETLNSYVLKSDNEYELGDAVYAIGTPNSIELGQTLSKGIISSIRKKDDHEWIQTDVSISPGNSGGALVSSNGDLIGIVNSKLVGFGVEGIAFCIPANHVLEMLSLSY